MYTVFDVDQHYSGRKPGSAQGKHIHTVQKILMQLHKTENVKIAELRPAYCVIYKNSFRKRAIV